MSTSLKRTTLDGDWAALTSSGATGIAQLQNNGPALLHLGAERTCIDSTDAMLLWEEGLQELPFLNAESGMSCTAKSKDGSSVDVTVTATRIGPHHEAHPTDPHRRDVEWAIPTPLLWSLPGTATTTQQLWSILTMAGERTLPGSWASRLLDGGLKRIPHPA